uniref:GTD-binding domain-containing protein n=1 Tax=Davidia involucrata TaxID=16924 RepID=A0A5B7BX67_DAVIN
MKIRGHFGLLFIVCSVLEFYKRFLEYFVGFFLMECISCLKFLGQNSDFGCGFLVFGCFSQLLDLLGLFLLFGFLLKVLQYGCLCKGLIQFLCDFRGKSSDLRIGVCSKNGFDGTCNSKISFCKCRLLNFLKNSDPPAIDKLEETKQIVNGNGDVKAMIVLDEEYDDGDEQESYGEDEVDVMALKKLVKIERRRANAACLELEKERTAAATAVEEAMAMILRLQNEKSLIEMEASQFRRLAEDKQLHDQQVIQSLRWIVMKHESERSLLEDQLRLFRRKLKLYMKDDEEDQSEEADEFLGFANSNIEDGLDDALISSLDMDLSPLGKKEETDQNPRTACAPE